MKRILESKKIFNVTSASTIDLGELKKAYRNFMKEWHPDKFRESDEQLANAEAQSKKIIEAYHFLVSIAPETHAANVEEYTMLTTTATIEDYDYKNQVLKIIFQNGAVYEYFGVPKSIFNKMGSAATLPRFARRHIFHSFVYRESAKMNAPEPVTEV
jgi:curved DNA-binding protein CbpA